MEGFQRGAICQVASDRQGAKGMLYGLLLEEYNDINASFHRGVDHG